MLRRLLLALLTIAVLTLSHAPVLRAQDDAAAFKDLATGSDYRLRVAAALALGKSKAPGARSALEKALGDSHPSVRAAAAAALGALGDSGAIPALMAAEKTESVASVKAQIETTMKRLSGGGAATASKSTTKPKFLVALGKLENRSTVKDGVVLSTLRASTKQKMSQVPGIEVIDEAEVASASKSRGLPGFTLDGSLTKLQKSGAGSTVSYSARVEYLIKKIPEHALKGSFSGSVEVQTDAQGAKSGAQIAQLESDAVAAAIDSALKGANPALEAAMR